jgi:hypothetical protein
MADNAFPHLPVGYEPGGQSLRNRAQQKAWSPFIAFVGTGMFMAGVWVAAGGRGTSFDRQEELWGGIFFALMGLMCIYGAGVIGGKGQPKRHPRLRGTTLRVEPANPRRGEKVSITFAGERSDDDRLEIGLVCQERYDQEVRVYVRGARVVRRQMAEAAADEQWRAVSPAVREQTFTFVVPQDAPYSYEGECVSYAWFASARSVRPRRKDPRLEEPIWVRP